MRTALVTLILGWPYRLVWREVCEPTWSAYAARHGYDVIAIDRPLDTSKRAAMRPLYWQKLLVLRPDLANGYDRVVWIDADIVINPEAPSVTDGVPIEKIGLTDESRFPSPQEHRDLQLRMANTHERAGNLAHAAVARTSAATSPAPQTGVMVLSPRHHRAILEAVYHDKEQDIPVAEQVYAGRAILENDLAHWIDPRFNALVYCLKIIEHRRAAIDTEAKLIAAIRQWISRHYFLHFAAEHALLSTALAALHQNQAANPVP